jgi:membrane-associated phospholipid phosphatase
VRIALAACLLCALPARADLGDHITDNPLDYTLVVSALAGYYALSLVPTHESPIIERSADMPFARSEGVPVWAVGVGMLATGGATLGVNAALGDGDTPTSDMALTYAGTLATTLFLTELSKVVFSRQRPDYADRQRLGLDDDLMNDGRKSFWSGHSSMSFASAVFQAWHLADLGLDRGRGLGARVGLWGGATLLTTTAGWVAYTRIEDGRHHVSDVLTGAVVGTVLGTFGYIRSRQIAADNGAAGSTQQQPLMLSIGGAF